MVLTPEERRAVVALAVLLAFGQVVAWWEKREAAKPDAELSAWLTRMAELRTAEDSIASSDSFPDAPAVETAMPQGPTALGEPAGSKDPTGSGEPVISGGPARSGEKAAGPGRPTRSGSARAEDLGGSAEPGHRPGPPQMQVRSREEIPPGVLETGKLRINEATAEQLESLPGVGPALAQRILAARRERPFSNPEDLLRVRGIGPRTLERLRPQIEVLPATATAEPSDPAASAEAER